ncbi:Gfo/Idh/MocA family protein [Limnoglobus roseus]|uniref:Putative Rossmann-fold-type glycoside hydrolase n=1 Tax=Limnoglobus roseus TaxID=2598579 RepID=A0A5C1A6J9_9BACT|nr:Gfo/Idh/MocA family oxidoreductase [Limnoglobus roseus]QEL13616.1 putative Rossmann-fold-type glycoside hydrolase [Limnoglobus roseus]
MSIPPRIRAGMVGLGMIFDETYRPFFEQVHREGLFRRDFGLVDVDLAAVATRTGTRAGKYRAHAPTPFANLTGPDAAEQLAKSDVDVVCVATPDDRHFGPAKAALTAGKHVLIEKPSVLSLAELDELQALADEKQVLAKVVYHKLLDPDHKKLRTHVLEGNLRHVNNGYCSLLEPKSISTGQFAEWLTGRNPGTYVACHYTKLIDFTFFSRGNYALTRISANGQRGLVGPADGNTWDSTQLQVTYTHLNDGREATFDIHTSWVTPDNFPGYVDQEVQFRFDNGVWNAHQRKRGVEVTIEDRSPGEFKYTPNHHYNGRFVEPWNELSQRGYGIEVIRRFFEEVAYVEHGPGDRHDRWQAMAHYKYNDLSAERNCVAIVQALEAILAEHAAGRPGGMVTTDDGLRLYLPGVAEPKVLYAGRV